MNLVKWLREAFTPETPENKFRIKVAHKAEEVRAQVFENGSWQTIKAVSLIVVPYASGVERCKHAIEQYKELGTDDKGVINL